MPNASLRPCRLTLAAARDAGDCLTCPESKREDCKRNAPSQVARVIEAAAMDEKSAILAFIDNRENEHWRAYRIASDGGREAVALDHLKASNTLRAVSREIRRGDYR